MFLIRDKKHFEYIYIILLLVLLHNSSELYSKNYKGAEYRTKESFLYGRFEVKYMPANREGVVSSFFTYHDPDSISTDWNEIDIEFVGRYSNIVQFNTITPGQKFHIRNNFIDFNPYLNFNTYAFEWTPEYVAWFVNGIEVYRQTEGHIPTLQYSQKIMMNIWNPIYTNWVGYWNDNLLPAFSSYDWVSYSSYTPGNGNYGTNNNFTFEWIDSLDSWDQDRWELATHTWGGNQADFIPGNVVFQDGIMYLCLTDKIDTGYVDTKKPEVKWARDNFDGSITVSFTEEIDKESAESISNYLISNVTVSAATLAEDRKTVKLQTIGYDKNSTYSLIVLNVQDDSPLRNIIDLRAVTIIKNNGLTFPIKINVGGDSYGDFLPDQEWSENLEYGYWAGDSHYWSSVEDVLNTEDDEIFKSEREGLTTYKIRVPNGLYKVSLLFAEHDNNPVGARVFNIVVENEFKFKDVDIISTSGINTAISFESEVEVNDEKIDLYFPEEVDSAFVNGIIIEQVFTNVEETKFGMNNIIELDQNYPNPFNPKTNIHYRVYRKSNILMEVFDVLGNKISTLVKGIKGPGNYNLNFESSNLPSGVYFYRLLSNGNNVATKKMAILK